MVNEKSRRKALRGLVGLDLTHTLSGPDGAMLLANCAAYSRQGMRAYFRTLNRGKESVVRDLKSEAGGKVFHDLVQHADIVIDNFSVGVTTRLGIDHDTLAAINPRMITGPVGGDPQHEGIPIGDLAGEVFGGLGILAAVAERTHSGLG